MTHSETTGENLTVDNLADPNGYVIQSEASLPALLAKIPAIAQHLGGKQSSWGVREVSDGNMNLVFSVQGSRGDAIVKQALPFIRVIGRSWPFPLSRIHFEHEALCLEAAYAPGRVPAVLHYDAEMALIVMERLTPHLVLRKGLVQGLVYPQLAGHIATFLARTLFLSSDLAISTLEKKKLMARFAGNAQLCATTEDVVFTGPYRDAPLNRWTRPHLDADVASLRADNDVKIAATEMKIIFRTATEALIHGDLHTGSIMVTDTDTRVIDSEWAFYGPMGFDVGAVIGNLLLAYFSQPGHVTKDDDRKAYQEWILHAIEEIWTRFEAVFLALWRAASTECVPLELFSAPEAVEPLRKRRMNAIMVDAIGFAGAKMIRRIVGISHVEDMESIVDPVERAGCERAALRLARSIMVDRNSFGSIGALSAFARELAVRNQR